MSQVQIDKKHSGSHHSLHKKSSSSNLDKDGTASVTSSRSKQSFVDEVLSGSDPNLIKNNLLRKKLPPPTPPPSKIISGFKPDQEPMSKSSSKSDAEEMKRTSSDPKVSVPNAMAPAPQFIFSANEDRSSSQVSTPRENKHHHHHHHNSQKDTDSFSSKRRRSSDKSSRKSTEKRSKHKHERSKKDPDAQSLVSAKKLSRSTEQFKIAPDAQSVIVKHKSRGKQLSEKPGKAHRSSIQELSKSQLSLRLQPTKDSDSKKKRFEDVTILSIPDDSPPRFPLESEKKNIDDNSDTISQDLRLPIPDFNGSERGDGLKPLETLADTTIYDTNAFGDDKYDFAQKNAPYKPDADLIQPVSGWLKFQVPIVPKPSDTEYERQASKMFDITRLLHQAKNC